MLRPGAGPAGNRDPVCGVTGGDGVSQILSSTLFLLGVNPLQHPTGGTEAASPHRSDGNLFVSPSGLRGLLGAWVSAERRGHGCDDFEPATC